VVQSLFRFNLSLLLVLLVKEIRTRIITLKLIRTRIIISKNRTLAIKNLSEPNNKKLER